jgi:hypothetical protein
MAGYRGAAEPRKKTKHHHSFTAPACSQVWQRCNGKTVQWVDLTDWS